MQRFDGVIRSWNEARGFGFIEPRQGGQEIFVHIKACRGLRPQVGVAVSFAVELNPQGKKRAVAVEPLRPATALRSSRRIGGAATGSAAWGTASYFALPAFAAIYLLAMVLWGVPAWVSGVYAGLSVLSFIAYWRDKRAATAKAWRTSEESLHLLAVLGGWPGALVAQQQLRHKSSKASFRAVFWFSVVLNVSAFLVLTSPLGRQLLPA